MTNTFKIFTFSKRKLFYLFPFMYIYSILMTKELENLKKKFYIEFYRGTKEMDILL